MQILVFRFFLPNFATACNRRNKWLFVTSNAAKTLPLSQKIHQCLTARSHSPPTLAAMNSADLLLQNFSASLRTLRIAMVTETYPPEINGVAMTISSPRA